MSEIRQSSDGLIPGLFDSVEIEALLVRGEVVAIMGVEEKARHMAPTGTLSPGSRPCSERIWA